MLLLYFVLWVTFNGKVTPEICVFGVVISLAVFAFTCRFMDYSIKKEIAVARRCIRFFNYVVVLVREIVKANFEVMHMILSEREELEPALVGFHSDLQNPTVRVLLANAITLTPGTITVSLEGSDYVVHCLDESLADGMDSSVFVELLSGLEKE